MEKRYKVDIMHLKFKNWSDSLDKFFAKIGMVMGLIFSSLYFISATIYLPIVGIPLFFGCLLYLFYFTDDSELPLGTLKSNMSLKKVYNILFVIFFTFSIYSLHLYERRSIVYFISISLCAMLLSNSIISLNCKKDILIERIKIILLSFNLIYSIYCSYSFVALSDSLRHAKMNHLLSLTGNINILWDKETFFPLMHIEVGISEILLNLGIKDATNIAVIVPFVISFLCVYLVGRKFFSEKVGMLAMLILTLTDYAIAWGSTPQTTTFGATLYFYMMFILSILFYSNTIDNIKAKKSAWVLMLLIFIISLILTHAVSSFIFLISLFGLLFGQLLYRYIYKEYSTPLLCNLMLVTTVGLIQHWMVALYRKGGNSFFEQIILFLVNNVSKYSGVLNRPESLVEYATMLPPFYERFVNLLGLSILLFLSIIGGLYWISHKYKNQMFFSIIFCEIFLMGLTFGFPFMGIRNIIPDRWFLFEYFFLSLMAAFTIAIIINNFNNPYKKIIFISILFFSFCFFMSASTISNTDSPLWLENSTPSIFFTENEKVAMETLTKVSSDLISDFQYGHTFLEINQNYEDGVILKESQIDSLDNRVFVWRSYTLKSPSRTIRELSTNYTNISYVKLQYVPQVLGLDLFKKLQKYGNIYNNGDVLAYYVTNTTTIPK